MGEIVGRQQKIFPRECQNFLKYQKESSIGGKSLRIK